MTENRIEIKLHRKTYEELQQTVTDLIFENCLLKKKMEWIPVEERLPEYPCEGWYMCIAKNHECEPPMILQFDGEVSEQFGLWRYIFNPVTYGFVDCVFDTVEDMGLEKVVAWMEIPPYEYDEEDEDYEE